MARSIKNRTDIVHIPSAELVELPIGNLPNPLVNLTAAGVNIRDIPALEGATNSERVRSAWGIDNLLPIIEAAPLTENFDRRNLIELERDPETGEITRIIDGNRRTCVFHLLAEMHPDGHEVSREVRGPRGGVQKVKFEKNYNTITVLCYPLLSDEQFQHLQKRDVIARRGLGKIEFYVLAFAAIDTFSRISEKELLLAIGAEVAASAFPNHKKGGAWRETLQNVRRVWHMPRFVRDQFMAKVRDQDKSQTKPTGKNVRDLNALWKQVMAADKAGALNNSLATVEALREAMEIANGEAKVKVLAFLAKWHEVMQGNGVKGGGKSSASKSAVEVDAAVESLKQAGTPMAAAMLKWQRATGGCGTEAVFEIVRDFFTAAESCMKEHQKEDYVAFYKRLNETVG